MSAVELDIDIYDNRSLAFEVFWYDSNDDPIDVSGYGAILVVVGENNPDDEIIRATHADYIGIGDTDGRFSVNIPPSETVNLGFKRGYWEFIVHPDSSDPTISPIELIVGKVTYKPTYASLS